MKIKISWKHSRLILNCLNLGVFTLFGCSKPNGKGGANTDPQNTSTNHSESPENTDPQNTPTNLTYTAQSLSEGFELNLEPYQTISMFSNGTYLLEAENVDLIANGDQKISCEATTGTCHNFKPIVKDFNIVLTLENHSQKTYHFKVTPPTQTYQITGNAELPTGFPGCGQYPASTTRERLFDCSMLVSNNSWTIGKSDMTSPLNNDPNYTSVSKDWFLVAAPAMAGSLTTAQAAWLTPVITTDNPAVAKAADNDPIKSIASSTKPRLLVTGTLNKTYDFKNANAGTSQAMLPYVDTYQNVGGNQIPKLQNAPASDFSKSACQTEKSDSSLSLFNPILDSFQIPSYSMFYVMAYENGLEVPYGNKADFSFYAHLVPGFRVSGSGVGSLSDGFWTRSNNDTENNSHWMFSLPQKDTQTIRYAGNMATVTNDVNGVHIRCISTDW